MHFCEELDNKSLNLYLLKCIESLFEICRCRVHVVFGHVLSGQEVVSHVEGLPVDRMCRPLQDAKVINCGELVLKMKTKGRQLSNCLEILYN